MQSTLCVTEQFHYKVSALAIQRRKIAVHILITPMHHGKMFLFFHL